MKKIIIVLIIITLFGCTKNTDISVMAIKKDTLISTPIVSIPIKPATPVIVVDSFQSKLLNGLMLQYNFNNNLIDSSTYKWTGEASNGLQYTIDRFEKSNSAINTKNGFVNVYKKSVNVSEFIKFNTPFQFARDEGDKYNRLGYNGATFTICMWFKINTNIPGGRILSTEAPNPESKNQFDNFSILYDGDGNIGLQFGVYHRFNTNINNWHFLVYSYDIRNEKIYLDNKLIIQNYNNSKLELSWNTPRPWSHVVKMVTQYSNAQYTTPLTIGAKSMWNYDAFAGSIDDIRIYNRILTESELGYLATH